MTFDQLKTLVDGAKDTRSAVVEDQVAALVFLVLTYFRVTLGVEERQEMLVALERFLGARLVNIAESWQALVEQMPETERSWLVDASGNSIDLDFMKIAMSNRNKVVLSSVGTLLGL